MWDMSYPPKVDMCIYVCAPPLLNDRLARVWRALIGAPFRIKVMDTRARVQMQVLYPSLHQSAQYCCCGRHPT